MQNIKQDHKNKEMLTIILCQNLHIADGLIQFQQGCSQHFFANEQEDRKCKIGLSYLPILKDDSKMDFSGQPVWYFVYDEVIGESSARAVSIYNAETGEIIK